MDGREIPGFYYDPERKKYFKVQANHQVPQGNKYSRENVKKAKAEEVKREQAARATTANRIQRVQRAAILDYPLAAVSINREHALGRMSPVLRSHALIQGLEHQTSFRLGEPFVTGRDNLMGFAYDQCTDGLLIATVGPREDILASVLPIKLPKGNSVSDGQVRIRPPRYRSQHVKPLHVFRSLITSLDIGPSRTLIATTLGSPSQPPSIYVTKLQELEFASHEMPLDNGFAALLSPQDNADVWCSAANPFENAQDTFAIGLRSGTRVLLVSEGQCVSPVKLDTPADVKALAWQDPFTLAAGLRDGTVKMWDTRTSDSVARLRHAGTITGLKRGKGSHSLIVCGIPNALAQYDLRMIRVDVPTMDRIYRKRKWTGVSSDLFPRQPASPPVVRFDYSNERSQMGFDVENDYGLVAAAQEDGSIAVYCTDTGERFKWVGDHLPSDKKYAKCLRFVHGVGARMGIMVARGNRVEEYEW